MDETQTFHSWSIGVLDFHVWFLPRPLGMLEAQKMMLPLWEEVLPQVDQVAIDEAKAAIAKALASDGG